MGLTGVGVRGQHRWSLVCALSYNLDNAERGKKYARRICMSTRPSLSEVMISKMLNIQEIFAVNASGGRMNTRGSGNMGRRAEEVRCG